MVAHTPLLLIPSLSPSLVWFFSPEKPSSLALGLSPSPLPFLLMCVSLPHSGATMCLSVLRHLLFAPSSRESPGTLPSPSRKARDLLAPIPPSTPPPPAACLAGPFPSLGLEVCQGFQGTIWMSEPMRLTETGPQHQAAGTAPYRPHLSCWPGRPHRSLFSLAGIFREHQHHH